MRVLAVGAHPDDIEFGCGATLQLMKEKGHSIFCIVMSGEGERYLELENASHFAGWNTKCANYTDTFVPCDKNSICLIEDEIKDIDVDIVFTHYHNDSHQDHVNTAKAVLAASRNVKNVLFYEGFTTLSLDFTPSVFSGFDDVMLIKKLDLLSKHNSQVSKTNITGRNMLEMAEAMAVHRGMMARTKYAEGFVPVRMFINL